MKFKIHNKIVSLVVLLSLSFTNYAQQDTVWVNKNYLICGKQEAKYYRLTPKKNGSYFEVQQYYLNGKLFFKGKSAKANEQQYEGEFIFFHRDS